MVPKFSTNFSENTQDFLLIKYYCQNFVSFTGVLHIVRKIELQFFTNFSKPQPEVRLRFKNVPPKNFFKPGIAQRSGRDRENMPYVDTCPV